MKPAGRSGLVVDVKYLSLGRERLFPAVGEGGVEVGSAVLVGRHAVMWGKVGSRGRGAGGELRHHLLLRVHGEMHGGWNLVGLVRVATATVHHLARIFPGSGVSVMAARERERERERERGRAKVRTVSLLTQPN